MMPKVECNEPVMFDANGIFTSSSEEAEVEMAALVVLVCFVFALFLFLASSVFLDSFEFRHRRSAGSVTIPGMIVW